MTLLLDAGALIAVERGDRELLKLIKSECDTGRPPVTHGGVLGQVWRGGSRQAGLAKLLPVLEIAPLDEELGRRAGLLLAGAGVSDVVDAALVALSRDGDDIATSDIDELLVLAVASGHHLELLRV